MDHLRHVRDEMKETCSEVMNQFSDYLIARAKELKDRGLNRWEIEDSLLVTPDYFDEIVLDPLFKEL